MRNVRVHGSCVLVRLVKSVLVRLVHAIITETIYSGTRWSYEEKTRKLPQPPKKKNLQRGTHYSSYFKFQIFFFTIPKKILIRNPSSSTKLRFYLPPMHPPTLYIIHLLILFPIFLFYSFHISEKKIEFKNGEPLRFSSPRSVRPLPGDRPRYLC